MKYQQGIVITLLLIIAAEPTQGTVYMWNDAAGATHYTNKEYEIPPRYSSRVKILYPDTAEKPVGQSNTTKEQVTSESQFKLPAHVLTTQPIQDKVQSSPRRKMKRQGGISSGEE